MANALPSSSRHELKIVVPAEELARVRLWVRLHRAGFAPTYPPRFVNNVYFDTETLALADEAIAGVGRRVKVRLRWYGVPEVISGGVFELKCKRGLVGWKRSHPIAATFDLRALRWQELVGQLRGELPDRFRRHLDTAYRIVLINRYRREYYETLDGDVRLTIDSEIGVHPQIARARPNLRFPTRERRDLVIEVKAAPPAWPRLPDVLNEFPVRITKNSKYVSGALDC